MKLLIGRTARREFGVEPRVVRVAGIDVTITQAPRKPRALHDAVVPLQGELRTLTKEGTAAGRLLAQAQWNEREAGREVAKLTALAGELSSAIRSGTRQQERAEAKAGSARSMARYSRAKGLARASDHEAEAREWKRKATGLGSSVADAARRLREVRGKLAAAQTKLSGTSDEKKAAQTDARAIREKQAQVTRGLREVTQKWAEKK